MKSPRARPRSTTANSWPSFSPSAESTRARSRTGFAASRSLTVQLLKHAPRLYPGVVDLVRELQGRARLAVVSGTWRENITAVLGAAGLADSFDLIIGKEDVTAVKPAPDCLSACAQAAPAGGQIDGRPGRFARGLASARAAGIRVIAVGHRRPFGEWVGDATYISGFEPAHGLLKHLGL